MKKNLTLFFSLSTITLSSLAQTILPVQTNEYCPLTEITFTVTIPGLNPYVYPSTNSPLVVRNVFNAENEYAKIIRAGYQGSYCYGQNGTGKIEAGTR